MEKTQREITRQNRMPRMILWLFWGMLIATILIRYAEPIKDGDIFFHIVYGKAVIENKTLTPDHTVYSWTVTDNDFEYCAWLGQVLLYLIHAAGGFKLLFLSKYLCLFLTLGILWTIMRKHPFSEPVFPILMLLIVSMGSYAGMFLKTEMFSLVLMALTAFLYFQAKQLLYGKKSYTILFFYPLLFFVWINTHGVWMFGLIIFSIMWAGEFLNRYTMSKDNFDPIFFKYLSASYLATLPVLSINPYGLSYAFNPVRKILRVVMPSVSSGDMDNGLDQIMAYNNLFTTINDPSVNLISIWFVMLIIFSAIYGYHVYKHKTWDWGIILVNTALCVLTVLYTRASYYWGPFWCLSCMYLLKGSEARPVFDRKAIKIIIKGVVIICFLFFSFLAVYKAVCIPYKNSWLGFGFNNFAPVDETVFLKKNRLGTRLYNSYKTGAYLMYALYPDYKVFIDARRFPYTKLLPDYLAFENGITDLETFNYQYPFDIALVDYNYDQIFIRFFNSEKWQPVYYGTAAAIFVQTPNGKGYDLKNAPIERFDRIGNLKEARRVFGIAMNFNDLDAGDYILNRMQTKFKHISGYQKIVTDVNNKVSGMKAYQKKEYDTAYHLLNQSDDQTIIPVTQTLLHLRVLKCKQLAAEEKYSQALALMETNLNRLPNHPDFLYAAGVMAYFSQDIRGNSETYKRYFNEFISRFPNHPHAGIARQILKNQQNLSIPLGL